MGKSLKKNPPFFAAKNKIHLLTDERLQSKCYDDEQWNDVCLNSGQKAKHRKIKDRTTKRESNVACFKC